MDIFEEIKEAVMSATPGEDTRNYYRNQGVQLEQERIIKLLESEYWHHTGIDKNGFPEHRAGCMACAQIALIKKEK